jgi:pimeloyl-ACP methyl ester carboxylesterase
VRTFVLIPGAGGMAWNWHRVTPLLIAAGHQAIAVDLPGDDQSAGLPVYAELVSAAMNGHDEVMLVAFSLGGFTAPLVAGRPEVSGLVLVNAMIPVPGETAGAWWDNTGALQARLDAATAAGYSPDFDEALYFLHDVPAEVLSDEEGQPRPEADAVFGSVCDFSEWPAVPVKVVAGADDRFFPVEFQRRVARERLGVAADVLPGGHLITLAQPQAVADYLLAV